MLRQEYQYLTDLVFYIHLPVTLHMRQVKRPSADIHIPEQCHIEHIWFQTYL